MTAIAKSSNGASENIVRFGEQAPVSCFFDSLPVELFAKIMSGFCTLDGNNWSFLSDKRNDPLPSIRALFKTSRKIRALTFSSLTRVPELFQRLLHVLLLKDNPQIIEQVLCKNLPAAPYTHLQATFLAGPQKKGDNLPPSKSTPSYVGKESYLKCIEKVMSLGGQFSLVCCSNAVTEDDLKLFDISRFTRLSFAHCEKLDVNFFLHARYNESLVEINLSYTVIENNGFHHLIKTCRKLDRISIEDASNLYSEYLKVADFPETLQVFDVEHLRFSRAKDQELEENNNGLSYAILALRHAWTHTASAKKYLELGKKVLPKLRVFQDIEKIIDGTLPRNPRQKARYYQLMLAAQKENPRARAELFMTNQKYEAGITGGHFVILEQFAEKSLYDLAVLLYAHILQGDFVDHTEPVKETLSRLEKALKNDPTCDFALAAAAFAQLQLGQPDLTLASDYAQRALALNSANEIAKAVLMNTLLVEAAVESNVSACVQSVKDNPPFDSTPFMRHLFSAIPNEDTSDSLIAQALEYFEGLCSLPYHTIEVNKLLESFLICCASFESKKAFLKEQIDRIIQKLEKTNGHYDTLLSMKIIFHIRFSDLPEDRYLEPLKTAMLTKYPDNFFVARHHLSQLPADE